MDLIYFFSGLLNLFFFIQSKKVFISHQTVTEMRQNFESQMETLQKKVKDLNAVNREQMSNEHTAKLIIIILP